MSGLSNWFSADLCANNRQDRDVSLSFRGPDSRGFANRLHSALDKVGILTFLDSKSLEKGDYIPSSLEQGIWSSRICIPIFSKNFAGSKWCLREVWFMEKCRKRIIPLFNHVSPSDVCNGPDGGIYKKDFERHEGQKTFSPEDIIELKGTLERVGGLPGWSYKESSGEEIVIEKVIKEVVKILLSEKVCLDIPKCFGLDWRAEYILRVLNTADHQKKIVKVGIHGMDGTGKTTLAKVVYKQLLYSRFELHCCLLGVGEIGDGENGLVNLQTQMLRDVSSFRGEVGSVDRGKAFLKDYLKGKKILLLLDDIQSFEQLEALGGNYSDLGEGSCLLITSQNQQILTWANVDEMHEVRGLPHEYALQLFKFHAFPSSSCPDPELQTLSNDTVRACGGLPLALTLAGKSLAGVEDRNVWKGVADNINCEPSLQNILRASYDTLDPFEKEMFLDVACFLTGREKEIVMIFWADLKGSSCQASLKHLLQKSLVNLGPREEFMIHGCLKNLGRNLANEMSPKLHKRTRLFDEDAMHSVMNLSLEKAKLVRYFMYEPKQPMTLRAEMFKSLYNLQFLRLTDVSIQGHFSGEFFMDLRWLSLRNYSSKRLPQGMNLQNLVILEVTHSQIIHLWDETTQKIPTTKPGNLKVLILRGCESLKNLPATLCYTLLRMLDLHNCHSLSSLPNTVKSWTSLVNLDMHGCAVSCLPEDFGELANLQELNLSYCHHLSKLPDSFGNLKNLRHLDLSGCMELMKLPVSFEDLTYLSHLKLHGCSKLALQSYILENMIRLVYLNLSGCRQLEELPDISNLTSLEELCLLEMARLRELPANIGRLINLKKMNIGSELLTSLPTSIGDLSSLISLDIGNCPNLHFIPYSLGLLKLEYF